MAAYITRDDVNLDPTRLAELTDSAAARGVIDPAVEAKVYEDASRELDGYLQGTYVTPAPAPVPDIIRTWTAHIARWRLYGRRPEMDPPKAVMLDYERTIKLAAASGSGAPGALALPIARVSSTVAPAAGEGAIYTEADDGDGRVFGRARDCL